MAILHQRQLRRVLLILAFVYLFPRPALHSETRYPGRVIADDGRFLKLSTGIVVDTRMNLMWAQSDNGGKISIEQARAYVDAFRLGNYNDWRIPTIQELETLLDQSGTNSTPPGEGCSGNYQIHAFFTLTCCCPWALQDNGTRPASYPFIKKISGGSMWHHKSGTIGNRVIPVRDMNR